MRHGGPGYRLLFGRCIPTHSSRDETFHSAKHQSCMYRAERIAELTGTFRVEERRTLRIPRRLHDASSFNARAFPLSSNVPELPSRIPDQIIDFYAFVFCQSGFRKGFRSSLLRKFRSSDSIDWRLLRERRRSFAHGAPCSRGRIRRGTRFGSVPPAH